MCDKKLGQKLRGHASMPPAAQPQRQMHFDSWCRRCLRDICLFVRRLEWWRGAHTNAHNTILAAAPEDRETAHMDHVAYPEQDFQCMHGMADFSPAHFNGSSSSMCSQHTSPLCPSLLLSVSDHHSFVGKIQRERQRSSRRCD